MPDRRGEQQRGHQQRASTSTATSVVASLRDRSLGSRELLESLLDRIDELNPALNAVVTLDQDAALAAATAADDDAARGRFHGPLHGLPMTIKDVWETAGLRTTSGARALADHVPDTDAVAVARLRDAGVIVFGKTNTPEWAGDIQTFNDVFGVTNNPWDTSRTPGGSSGGAAAAVSAGLTPLELGSDIGGSIRLPSHCCGTFGLKPSWGTVPSRGHIPGPPGSLIETDVNCGGPIGRSVDDLRLAFTQIAGPLDTEAVGWRLDLPAARVRDGVKGMRIALSLDEAGYPLAAEVHDVITALAGALESAGAIVEAVPLPVPLAEGHRTWMHLVMPVIGSGLPDRAYGGFVAMESDLAGDDLASLSGRLLIARHRDWAMADQRRQEHRRRWAEHFDRHDLVLAPVLPVPAFEHQNDVSLPARTSEIDGRTVSHLDFLAWCGAIGSVLLPVVTIPAGCTHERGLPVGVQLIGPYLHDLDLLDMADHITEVSGGFRAPAMAIPR